MVLTRWTNEITSKFISLYREQECLWRNDSLIYRNKDARDAALKKVIVGMNLEDLTVDDVKKKIKHLRSTYMIEAKKIERSVRSGTSTIYKPSLAWFAEMDAFIKYLPDIEISENGEQSVSDANKEKASGSEESDQLIDMNRTQQEQLSKRRKGQTRNFDMQDDNVTDVILKNPDSNRSSQTGTIKRSRLSQLSFAVKDRRGFTADLRQNRDDTEEFEVYGKYVGLQLKCMDEEDAILAQQEIQSILTKFKLKKVRRKLRHSGYQSSPSEGQYNIYSDDQYNEIHDHDYEANMTVGNADVIINSDSDDHVD